MGLDRLCAVHRLAIKQQRQQLVLHALRMTSIVSAEVDGGKKLEACLADFGLSAVLPSPKQHKDSPLL